MTHPLVTVVMPVFNVERYIAIAIRSVLKQTYEKFELLIIDDGSKDGSVEIAEGFLDPRIRIIQQANRGLAGARNTGIRNARGKYVAFLDSDDAWAPTKLEVHVEHLERRPCVGVSYSGSRLIDDHGRPMGITQSPKNYHISPADIFLRNPVGNGSAPVIRRSVFDHIKGPYGADGKIGWFDEHFRQSEDIECWMRIALETLWKFEGVNQVLTDYRVNAGGLSANIVKQFETWSWMRDRVARNHPDFGRRWAKQAEAFQLRYLARRAINMRDRGLSLSLAMQAITTDLRIMIREPVKTLVTLGAALTLRVLPAHGFDVLHRLIKGGSAEPNGTHSNA